MLLLDALIEAATVVTGLMAGLYLGWAISVLPGLALLSDPDYLNAFQKMNRAILNPRFKALFVSALALPAAAAVWVLLGGFPDRAPPLIAAAILLIIGHGAVTAFGNIPINEDLDGLDLPHTSRPRLRQQRRAFEQNWRRWHWARTFATTAAFGLLLWI